MFLFHIMILVHYILVYQKEVPLFHMIGSVLYQRGILSFQHIDNLVKIVIVKRDCSHGRTLFLIHLVIFVYHVLTLVSSFPFSDVSFLCHIDILVLPLTCLLSTYFLLTSCLLPAFFPLASCLLPACFPVDMILSHLFALPHLPLQFRAIFALFQAIYVLFLHFDLRYTTYKQVG